MTATVIISEIGDIRRFQDPRQILKMAGLSLRENSSGKLKGKTTISKRGRKRLGRLVPGHDSDTGKQRRLKAFLPIYENFDLKTIKPLIG